MARAARRFVPKTPGGWLTAGLLVVLLTIGGLQATNPHSYVSEVIARIAETESGPEARLTDLSSVNQLQAAFNADAGKPRLILLLSPT
jgi:hypothetical protein